MERPPMVTGPYNPENLGHWPPELQQIWKKESNFPLCKKLVDEMTKRVRSPGFLFTYGDQSIVANFVIMHMTIDIVQHSKDLSDEVRNPWQEQIRSKAQELGRYYIETMLPLEKIDPWSMNIPDYLKSAENLAEAIVAFTPEMARKGSEKAWLPLPLPVFEKPQDKQSFLFKIRTRLAPLMHQMYLAKHPGP